MSKLMRMFRMCGCGCEYSQHPYCGVAATAAPPGRRAGGQTRALRTQAPSTYGPAAPAASSVDDTTGFVMTPTDCRRTFVYYFAFNFLKVL
ncbi:hypothetical protein EVAR_79393_1 [Eumeta japonica]|uniref:Uncharacterized protein n=1 Tax=Eumeta variegata TaxID=151549 RepID=A0A4C1VFS8_EUMVA|nr:hypothetical protein EVAR_79393_1 [Eumeta japonica]